MKAYRVRLIGTQDTYLITEKQKSAIEEVMKKKEALITIGGNIMRSSVIRCITEANVDLDSCPSYFQEAVKREGMPGEKGTAPSYRKLPTQWLLLGVDGRILSTSISRMDERMVSQALGEESYYVAKCHYRIGNTGEREYITNFSMIPEAIKVKPELEDANSAIGEERFVYGDKKW